MEEENMGKEIEVITLDDTFDSEEGFHSDVSNHNELICASGGTVLTHSNQPGYHSPKDGDKKTGSEDGHSVNGDDHFLSQPGTSELKCKPRDVEEDDDDDDDDGMQHLVSSEDSLCLNCFGEEAFKDLVQCTAGHFFCQQCFRDYVTDSVLILGQKCVACMVPVCTAFFTKELVKKYIPKDLPDVMGNSVERQQKNLDTASPRHSETEDEDVILGLLMEKFPDVDPKYIATLLPVFQNSGSNMVKDICAFLKSEVPRYAEETGISEDTCEEDISNSISLRSVKDGYLQSSNFSSRNLPVNFTSSEVEHSSLSQTSNILEEIRKSLPYSHEFTITPVILDKKAMSADQFPVTMKKVPSHLQTSNELSSLSQSHQSGKCKKKSSSIRLQPSLDGLTGKLETTLKNVKDSVGICSNISLAMEDKNSNKISQNKIIKCPYSNSLNSSKTICHQLAKSDDLSSVNSVNNRTTEQIIEIQDTNKAKERHKIHSNEKSLSSEDSLTQKLTSVESKRMSSCKEKIPQINYVKNVLQSNDVDDDERAVVGIKKQARIINKKKGFIEKKSLGTLGSLKDGIASRCRTTHQSAYNNILRQKRIIKRWRYPSYYHRNIAWRNKTVPANTFPTA